MKFYQGDHELEQVGSRDKKIVPIAGGTGLYVLLSGLKKYFDQIIAIVTMADNGGCSRVLRDEFGILPPGDVRKALIALANESEGEQLLLRQLFDHRFEDKGSLNGRSLGNLILAGLTTIMGTEAEAIEAASRILRTQGQVLPVSEDNVDLVAELDDEQKTIVRGEEAISEHILKPRAKIDSVVLDPVAVAYKKALKAIEDADVLLLGPGDLYSSVIANLLVKGIPETICGSRAKVIYVCNIMTTSGETHGYKASAHVKEIIKYLGGDPKCLDGVIVNLEDYPPQLLAEYRADGSHPVVADLEEVAKLVKTVIAVPMASKDSLLRHDPDKLAQAVRSMVSKLAA